MAAIELRRYRAVNGRVPFSDWIHDLDSASAGRVQAYVDRLRTGNFGHTRSVGGGVLELKIKQGPGYRVYFLRDGRTIVLLLCGGDKKTQRTDINEAQGYATDYWRRR